ncbi:hypothetical protein HPB47_026169 [Ixodes persulcatus]|uniref:Uncharacterized protein n=1 Tax=Ixodes persulcatus TaxID=34615 RepID=A0AC60PZG4_IXOPE|nr:hypothetical protein HPB47_026169 [Ixodes persulcatus]
MSDQLFWISFLLMLGCLADPLRGQLLQLYSGDVDPRTTCRQRLSIVIETE